MDRGWDLWHDEGGVALLVTLVIVTLVAVVVLDLNYLMRVEVHSAANFRDKTRAYYVAKSGVMLVGELLRRDFPELAELKRQLLAGVPQTLPLGEDAVTVRVVDEQGKINLNALVPAPATAPPGQRRPGAQAAEPPRTWLDITQDLFQRLDVDPRIVGALVDWIDADDLPTGSGGAENNYYRSLEKPYVARNAPMETITELRLIRGVTDQFLLTLGAKRVGGIVDPATNVYLTVLPFPQGGQWRINLNTAPLPLLQSVTREVGALAERLVERRSQQWITNMAELQELGITGTALQDFQQYGTLSSSYFTVQALGKVGEVTSLITALIQTPQVQGSPTPAGGLAGSQPSPSPTGGTLGSSNPASAVAGSQPSQSLTGGTPGPNRRHPGDADSVLAGAVTLAETRRRTRSRAARGRGRRGDAWTGSACAVSLCDPRRQRHVLEARRRADTAVEPLLSPHMARRAAHVPAWQFPAERHVCNSPHSPRFASRHSCPLAPRRAPRRRCRGNGPQ